MIDQAPVLRYATIDSTNTEARRLFEAGDRGPVFLLADEQRAGRGRMERIWVSPPGNCYATLLLPVTADPAATPQIGFVVALAVADTVETHIPGKAAIKWPNDVLVGGAKISGILCEFLAPDTIAIGCGINIAHAPEGLAYPVTCLAQHGSTSTRDDVFQTYRASLAYWLGMWNNGMGTESIRTAWRKRAIGIGEMVSMQSAGYSTQGTFEGINAQGAIVLRDVEGQEQVFHAGDLVIPSLAVLRRSA